MIWSLKAGIALLWEEMEREREESLGSGLDSKQVLAYMSYVGWATVAEGGGDSELQKSRRLAGVWE